VYKLNPVTVWGVRWDKGDSEPADN